jgi:hypothetical protein
MPPERRPAHATATQSRMGAAERAGASGMRLRAHKYHAKPTDVDGIRFASQREAIRYKQLRLLERTGEIRDLELQPVFPLHVVKLYRNNWPIELATVAKYIADFRYLDKRSGEIVVEDAKGFKTETYRLKKKLVEAIHGITISEV